MATWPSLLYCFLGKEEEEEEEILLLHGSTVDGHLGSGNGVAKEKEREEEGR